MQKKRLWYAMLSAVMVLKIIRGRLKDWAEKIQYIKLLIHPLALSNSPALGTILRMIILAKMWHKGVKWTTFCLVYKPNYCHHKLKQKQNHWIDLQDREKFKSGFGKVMYSIGSIKNIGKFFTRDTNIIATNYAFEHNPLTERLA